MGGGEVAERKARLLLDAGAALTVNASQFNPQFRQWATEGRLTLVVGEFNADLLVGKWLAIAATDRVEVNRPGLSVRQSATGFLQCGGRSETCQFHYAVDYRPVADHGCRLLRW
ncbi:Siroheme synthase [Serratia odorifera]|uniref:precorrin-2 dehydrogenase n=1 Tax=Serratia odorifera TaxID=618 RepID=A0A3S4DVS3_SEROD|nr:Siroheme synthase [Serratia odorifera]